MKKEKGKIRGKLKAGGLLSLIVIGAIVGGIYLFSVNDAVVEYEVEAQKVPTQVTGDADPGDNSGFFYFQIRPHEADPETAYATNQSNATAYEYSDSGNVSATGETPFETTFDILIKVGVTDEDGQWSSNNTWNDAYMWLNLTCADLSISADTDMNETEIANTSSYRWMHYWLNNAGAGYTITEGESFNITSAKYYVMRIVP